MKVCWHPCSFYEVEIGVITLISTVGALDMNETSLGYKEYFINIGYEWIYLVCNEYFIHIGYEWNYLVYKEYFIEIGYEWNYFVYKENSIEIGYEWKYFWFQKILYRNLIWMKLCSLQRILYRFGGSQCQTGVQIYDIPQGSAKLIIMRPQGPKTTTR